MTPTEFSVRHPVSITMMIVILVTLGLISIFGLPLEMFPSIEFPIISVSTTYEGAAPQEIEERVTKPIERAVSAVEDVKSIRSWTREGSSFVMIQFHWGADTEVLRVDVREKLDAIRSVLPDDIDDPIVSRLNFGGDAEAIRIAVTSDTVPLEEVRRLAEDVLKSRFESIDDVATVDVHGGTEREIQVNIHPHRIKVYDLPVTAVADAIRAANLNNPGGRVERGRDEYLVRTVGKFRSLDEIRDLPVHSQNGGRVTVGDLATVVDTHKDVRSLSRFNGLPTVELAVLKESDGNAVAVSDGVREKIGALEEEFPQLRLGVAFDSAPFIRKSVINVQESALWGGFFAILVLWPFLSDRRWRTFAAIAGMGTGLMFAGTLGPWLEGLLSLGAGMSGALSLLLAAVFTIGLIRLLWRSSPATLVISLAMPISIVSTFILIKFSGISLNVVSLGGLALGVGMLVDNSVVVIENIQRHLGFGKNPRRAAIEGTSEVGLAILISTLTTLAVFLPIAWIEGIAREIFNDLSLTVSFSLITSLVVAVTIVPMMAAEFITRPQTREGSGAEPHVTVEDEIAALAGLQIRLRALLTFLLRKKRRTGGVLLGAFALFALSILGLANHPKAFFPPSDRDSFAISLKMPRGTAFDVIDRVARQIEARAGEDPDVESVLASVHAAKDTVVGITLHENRVRHSQTIQADLRKSLQNIPDAEVGIQTFEGMGGARPIDVRVLGDDRERLIVLGTILKQKLETVPGAADVRSSIETGRPELQVEVDRLRLADLGLSVRTVADVVETAMEGRIVGQYTEKGDEVDIRVQYDPAERSNLATLTGITVHNAAGRPITLIDVARVGDERGPVEIQRLDQRRMVLVDANLGQGAQLGDVAAQLEKRMADVPFPVGYSWQFSGEEERRAEAFSGLAISLGIAIVLVYMLMAALFESLMQPFVIMFTIPLALIGTYLGLALFGHALSVPAYIGVILLAGIVVNNAIVLLDYTNRLRRRGLPRGDAVALAAAIRLRPIVMTAGTTVLGMLPLALGLGQGAKVLQSLAAGVVGGLTVSTLLTLVVVPCAYDLVDRVAARLRAVIIGFGVNLNDPFAAEPRPEAAGAGTDRR